MTGLYIQPLDGGKMIDFSQNIRVPTYIGAAEPELDQDGHTNSYHSISGNGQLFIIPRRTAIITTTTTDPGAQLKPIAMSNIQISGGHIYCEYDGFNTYYDRRKKPALYDVFEIFNTGNGNFGLIIRNSTDFTVITNTNVIGQCILRRNISFTGSYGLGVDNDCLVFAHWDDGANASIYLNRDSMTIEAYDNNFNANQTINNMEVVIFKNTPPSPHNGGLTLWRTDGTCVFSSARPPLVWRNGLISPHFHPGDFSGPNIAVSRMMVPLCTVGCHSSGPVLNGGLGIMGYAGIKMTNNQITTQRSRSAGVWNEGRMSLSEPYFKISTVPLPIIDAADYFY